VASKAVVIGSGAGGSVAAYTLVQAGWDVTVLEKGVDHFGQANLTAEPIGPPHFGSDEVKESLRHFSDADAFAEPRTFRGKAGDTPFVGNVNHLPTGVGGGTMHWDAKTPRFWEVDFHLASTYGVPAGSSLADWPITYADIEPYYTRTEHMLGVQGDATKHPDFLQKQTPRSKPYPMAPGPQQLDSVVIADGAKTLGYKPFPFAMAANSVDGYDGRPACVNCGLCSGFGCPNQSRGGAAVTFLRKALQGGAQLITEAFAFKVETNGRKATGVRYLDVSKWPQRKEKVEHADLVVLALSPIETARLALLSGIGNSSDQVGRNLMFHWFTYAFGVSPTRLHGYMGRASTQTMEDFVVPDTVTGKALGLPYLRGGNLELGGTSWPIAEATTIGVFIRGRMHKDFMRVSPIRDRIMAITMGGEDMPTADKRVDLDPTVKDVYGFPVARVTYSPHNFELVSQATIGPKLAAILKAAGALAAGFIPRNPPVALPGLSTVPSGAHIMGTMRMGDDPKSSVVDHTGRMHDLDNVLVTDGGVFPSASGHNPTLTIMSVAWHSMDSFLGAATPATAAKAVPTQVHGEGAELPATGAKENAALALGATAAGLAGVRAVTKNQADSEAPSGP
jgi:gluconate 2-dehydrogenase alpha chain